MAETALYALNYTLFPFRRGTGIMNVKTIKDYLEIRNSQHGKDPEERFKIVRKLSRLLLWVILFFLALIVYIVMEWITLSSNDLIGLSTILLLFFLILLRKWR